MMMGDLVLLENQVNSVMDVALENKLEVTALHNHFFWDSPKVMFMHIGGEGEIEALAGSVGKVFQKIRETINEEPRIPYMEIDPSKTALSSEKIEKILGAKGTLKDGVFKVVIGRVTGMNGQKMGKEMGVNTWAAFAGSDEKAIVDGDFAMLESELQVVLKVLRKSNISIVAIHNHMIMENPRMIFLHYWGTGSTENLTKALQSALNVQQIEAASSM